MQRELTPRQLTILRLVAEGKSDAEIAEELGLAVSTVKTHLASVYRVFRVHSRVKAVVAAHRSGVLTVWGEQLSFFETPAVVADLREQIEVLEAENARLRRLLTGREVRR